MEPSYEEMALACIKKATRIDVMDSDREALLLEAQVYATLELAKKE